VDLAAIAYALTFRFTMRSFFLGLRSRGANPATFAHDRGSAAAVPSLSTVGGSLGGGDGSGRGCGVAVLGGDTAAARLGLRCGTALGRASPPEDRIGPVPIFTRVGARGWRACAGFFERLNATFQYQGLEESAS